MLVIYPSTVMDEGSGAEKAAEALRLNILARLAVEPATLHKLLDDLRYLEETGLQPPGYTLRDVLTELRLYRRAGIVYEDLATAKLYADLSILRPETRSTIYKLAATIAEVLGLERQAAETGILESSMSLHV
ncbi:hypothetical protein Pyrde_0339 [Pyrodictium delaneyi]|uniref:Uncharacterized protein n=2 Tax=Pyrodictium delaneyi TaxID=1273541 RepID=A0A0P0N297_9CREN|nr:hypothetical protein [Pyrodictium delaneyi]ALL00389.1 hypothetical protein Pyrde_0339 [Pyrodictium delaneyi]